ncbi:hypothetical protein F5876DRAFT_80616 [Lentinula aff. lateritia]|uniref:Uncharacterized protein n=1 Tax=Lentinula aff. lateritia TaxID=2804960 RepID=A0ACC1TPB9_9AGAR|nr:hypothetical protein F5876DRAFT_80616 [Lentinula aff. lateritia]
MPSSPDKTCSASPHFAVAASSSIPFEQGGVLSVVSEDDKDINQLAFTLDTPSRPLDLFEKVFNTGKSLASYSQDDPFGCSCLPSWVTSMFGLLVEEDLQILHFRRRFLELHGTPAQKVSWAIPVDLWYWYDALLHQRTSSTTTLIELSMLDEEAAALKHKWASSPSGPGEATSSNSCGKTSQKRHCHLTPPSASLLVAPQLVHLVVPPGRPSHPKPVADTNPSMLPTSLDPIVIDDSILPRDSRNQGHPIPVASNQPGSVQGPTDLVCLAAIAEQRAGADHAPLNGIKGIGQDLLSSSMPPSLSSCSCLGGSACGVAMGELSSLTSALQDTLNSLEARQHEVEQLRTSQQEVIWQGLEYSRVLDQFQTLARALPGRPEQTLLETLREIQEKLITAREEREQVNHLRSASTQHNSELQASLEQQQGLVDESNALAAHQRQRIETLQEEVHQFHDLSKLEGELTRTRKDLCRVATFAHRLYSSSPGSALQHHYRHLGGLIEAMIALLWQGLDSTEPNLIVRNFQLVLEYLQAARGIHGELHVRTLIMLGNLQFSDDFPFLTIAQHASYAPPFESALEPPLHHRMFALDTALPHHDAGRWEDTVPTFPSLDHFIRDWEELMVSYVHHLSDTPLPEPPAHADIAVGDDTVISLPVSQTIPLFLPEQPSPTSPSPPPTSPVPPATFRLHGPSCHRSYWR